MRVNEVLARLDDLELIKLSTREICWQGTKIQKKYPVIYV